MNGQFKTFLFSVIGILIMLLGFVLPPIGTITSNGMCVASIFIGALWLWSTVGGVWPSLLAILLFGFSGYYGDGTEGLTGTFSALFGDETFIILIMMFVIFGGVNQSRCSQYIARWLLTRKMLIGHPYCIIAFTGFTTYLLAVTTNAFAALLVMWSVLVGICAMARIEHGKDKIWTSLFGITFLGASLGHCALPFSNTGFAMNRAYNSIIGAEYPLNAGGYIVFNFCMTLVMFGVFICLIKFVFKPDLHKLADLTLEDVQKSSQLPPISKKQKAYLYMLPIFVLCLMLPTFNCLAGLPIISIFKILGISGTSFVFVIVMSLIRFDGKPMLDFAEVARYGVMWNIVFLVVAAKNIGTALSNSDLGVTAQLKILLNPILNDKPEWLVVLILCCVAIVVTNFANNVSMAITFMPIVLVFSKQMGLNPAPIMLCIMILVFIAMMTPGASTQAALCYGSENYTPKEIRSYAIPLSIIAVLVFTFIGYPLAKFLVG